MRREEPTDPGGRQLLRDSNAGSTEEAGALLSVQAAGSRHHRLQNGNAEYRKPIEVQSFARPLYYVGNDAIVSG